MRLKSHGPMDHPCFFFSDPEVEMLELQVVAQPKVGVEASFSRNSVGKLRS